MKTLKDLVHKMNREQELEFLIENKKRMVFILESDVNQHQNELDDIRLDEQENIFVKEVLEEIKNNE